MTPGRVLLHWLIVYLAVGVGFFLGRITARPRRPGEHVGWVLVAMFEAAWSWPAMLRRSWRASRPGTPVDMAVQTGLGVPIGCGLCGGKFATVTEYRGHACRGYS